MKRALAIALVATYSAFGQCVMCFRTAAAQQAERARVMNLGIIIMLIPPVVILGGFMLLCYMRRQTYAAGAPAENVVAGPELTAVLPGDK
jgi:heme/copper-type cytochrome/quinol oxidase subunit 2